MGCSRRDVFSQRATRASAQVLVGCDSSPNLAKPSLAANRGSLCVPLHTFPADRLLVMRMPPHSASALYSHGVANALLHFLAFSLANPPLSLLVALVFQYHPAPQAGCDTRQGPEGFSLRIRAVPGRRMMDFSWGRRFLCASGPAL